MEPDTPAPHALRFTGDGGTYFGIWIVNLLLTIVTVGLYSPWAKVRRLRYFYGNTLLDDSPFAFHGSPVALLKGRLIALALLVAYSQSAKVSLTLWLCVVSAIAVALPWLLWKSLKFRLANSSYRGIRFGFDASMGQAYAAFALPIFFFLLPYALLAVMGFNARINQPPTARHFLPVIGSFLVLAALAPWFYLRIKRFQHGNARLGSTPFSFAGTAPGAYGLAFAIVGLGILAAILAVIVGALSGFVVQAVARALGSVPATPPAGGAMTGNAGAMAGISAGIAAGYAILLCVVPIATALRQNFIWGRTSLGGGPFRSAARGLALLRISAVNAFLIVVTLGLYWPYAVVRTLRYELEAVSWQGNPASVIAHASEEAVTATGEETAEIFGFDLAL